MVNKRLALLGLFILSFLLYRRLFKIRLPREILPTQDLLIIGINIFLCVSTFIVAGLFSYLFYKFLLNKENMPSTNVIIIKLITLSQSKWSPLLLLQDSLLALDIYLKNKSPMYDEHGDYVAYIITFISLYFCKYKKTFLFIFIMTTIIFQTIVVITFVIDIFIYAKFYYFYKTLWLLIFPLLGNYIIHSIKAFTDTNLKSLEDVLTLKVVKASEYELHQMDAPIFEVSVQDWRYIAANTPPGLYLCMNMLSPEYIKKNLDLDHEETLNYCVDRMGEFFLIYLFLDEYTLLKKKIILPFNIIKYLLYTFCWGYILYLILILS